MTSFKASLETVLHFVEPSGREQALLENCAIWRQLEAGEDVHHNATFQGGTSFLFLVRGELSITRRPVRDVGSRAPSDPAIRITATGQPVLVPPSRPSLCTRTDSPVEILEFSDADCAFLLGTCRAFRALVFAAANAGVSQLTDVNDLPIGHAEKHDHLFTLH